MKYQLFDTESGNLVGQYPSRDDALRVVLESFNKFGSQWASDLALHEDAFESVASLGVKTPSGPVIAEGKALIELARSTVAGRNLTRLGWVRPDPVRERELLELEAQLAELYEARRAGTMQFKLGVLALRWFTDVLRVYFRASGAPSNENRLKGE